MSLEHRGQGKGGTLRESALQTIANDGHSDSIFTAPAAVLRFSAPAIFQGPYASSTLQPGIPPPRRIIFAFIFDHLFAPGKVILSFLSPTIPTARSVLHLPLLLCFYNYSSASHFPCPNAPARAFTSFSISAGFIGRPSFSNNSIVAFNRRNIRLTSQYRRISGASIAISWTGLTLR